MNTVERDPFERLGKVLRDVGPSAVAVSGGVDSMTLAALAHQLSKDDTHIYHAVSAAVPLEATRRVRELAEEQHWNLHLIDAGELERPSYVANPIDRCQHCKDALYTAIARHTPMQILSGANLDDLSDYRPGLQAAARAGVRHPYVEARMDKAAVRAVARHLGLTTVSELPASPCLSSRVQTGIAISAPMLRGIDEAERLIRAWVDAHDVRCRVRREGIVVELDSTSLEKLDRQQRDQLGTLVSDLLSNARAQRFMPARFEPYRVGSAFIRSDTK